MKKFILKSFIWIGSSLTAWGFASFSNTFEGAFIFTSLGFVLFIALPVLFFPDNAEHGGYMC